MYMLGRANQRPTCTEKPSGKTIIIGGRKNHGATWTQHAVDLFEQGMRVDYMLDRILEHHDIKVLAGEIRILERSVYDREIKMPLCVDRAIFRDFDARNLPPS